MDPPPPDGLASAAGSARIDDVSAPPSSAPARPAARWWRTVALLLTWILVIGGAAAYRDWRDDAEVRAATGPGTTEAGPTGGSTSTPAPGANPGVGSSTEPTTTAAPTTTMIMSTGRFVTSPGTGERHGTGPLHTYRTEVEEGTGVDPAAFAAVVDGILADQRGWVGVDGVSFQRVDTDSASFTITLATPDTTDQICLPLQTNGKFSCREGTRAVLNLRRWLEGTTDLPLSVDDYRAEVVNHEVGHVLGHGHLGCGGAGLAAPVMMQQSKGLDGCRANPWPALDGT